ncbi:MAG: DUF1343 domain-containing protein, partial [Bacteroidota bacterium]
MFQQIRLPFLKYLSVSLSLLIPLLCQQVTPELVPTVTDEAKKDSIPKEIAADTTRIVLGIDRTDLYLPQLQDKKVALLVNQTSVQSTTQQHLVDFLLGQEINVVKIFAPEHGFRGTADAGEQVKDGRDILTGLPIISLYGKNKKPNTADLADIDIVVFDIQDVGARFYTYISSMHYMMEACAEQEIDFLVLDRPNPNGHYLDGPILDKQHQSFVGMHPVPVVHGMTVGEYARMINGEGWLSGGIQCSLSIVPCLHYTSDTFYELPIKPSPNLPN